MGDELNPKRAIERRLKEAGAPSLYDKPEPDPRAGVDRGDLPGPNSSFFKPRDHSKDKEGLERALKKRG